MNSILSGTLNSLDQFNAGQKQQLYESSQVDLAAVSREQSADITIVTKEGDKVTLSADSSFMVLDGITGLTGFSCLGAVSYTHLTLPTTPYV